MEESIAKPTKLIINFWNILAYTILIITTFIALRNHIIMASFIGFLIASYIGLSEYFLSTTTGSGPLKEMIEKLTPVTFQQL